MFFLWRFYYPEESALESSYEILSVYLKIYNLSKELNPDSNLEEFEEIISDCFCK
jgi:hypothetical protein